MRWKTEIERRSVVAEMIAMAGNYGSETEGYVPRRLSQLELGYLSWMGGKIVL